MNEGKDRGEMWHELDKYDESNTRGYRYMNAVGAKRRVFSKVFTGTLDNDDSTSITHGIADHDKVLSVIAMAKRSGNYDTMDFKGVASATNAYKAQITSTEVTINEVGSAHQGENYRVVVEYYL